MDPMSVTVAKLAQICHPVPKRNISLMSAGAKPEMAIKTE